MSGNTYLTAQQKIEQLGKPVNKAIVDTAIFLKEQGKVPQANADYSAFVTSRFVEPLAKP
nr:taurine ABC transporter substrate-binding protein [Candidatus Pantoea persica]